jgi:choline dehydrogenase-like flavoprotein
MNSQSRGEVTLASADPADKPVINPRYLSNPYDGLVFKEAMREARRYVEAPSLKKFIKKPILAPASDGDAEIEVRCQPTDRCGEL